MLNPDTKKFPALNGVEGIEVFLEHGDTLFMPTGYWHWMKYVEGGYSLSLRARDASLTRKAARSMVHHKLSELELSEFTN